MSEPHATANEGGPAPAPMAGPLKVFISYSRADAHFADDLTLALTDKGFEPLIDRHGIDAGEEWKQRLGELIQACDTVVFVLTEKSASSAICAWEVERACQLSKRMFVVTPGPVPSSVSPPAQLAGINWVHCWRNPDVPGSSYQKGVLTLDAALRVNLPWIRQQTQLQEQAARWLTRERAARAHLLLRGDLLDEALNWAARAPKGVRIPSEVEAYITASEAIAHDLERMLHGVNANMVAAKTNLEFLRERLLASGQLPTPAPRGGTSVEQERFTGEIRQKLEASISLIDDLDFQLKKIQRDHYEIDDRNNICRNLTSVLRRIITAAPGIAYVNSRPTPRFSSIKNEGAMPAVRGSDSTLLVVFRNLVENSIKYARADEPAQIQIWFELDDVHVRVHVEIMVLAFLKRNARSSLWTASAAPRRAA